MPQLIITTSPGSEGEAARELRKLDAKMDRWLADGVGLVDSGIAWTETAVRLHREPPIWIRHIHPVQSIAPLQNDGRDFLVFESLLPPALMELDIENSFSVQTRLLSAGVQWQYSRYDINERLAAVVNSWGASLDVQNPFQVLSVTCSPERAFIGLSRAQDNLSNWTGGERRFKRMDGQVSRAEFKLLEAFEVFKIKLPDSGKALDLGAAPGGWTRLLAQRGMHVTAVDPAQLDRRVADLPNVTHIQKLVQDVKLKGKYDLIVNDMRMDAREAARVILSLADLLTPNGVVIMTLKLPELKSSAAANAALNMLLKRFECKGARQLFHNRSEITLMLGLA